MILPVYRDEQRNTWFVSTRYQSWTGEHKQKVKRGFSTKKEAQSWEREFLQKQSADMDMSFKAFAEIYFSDKGNRLKERTIKNKKYMIGAKVLPFLGDKPMNAIKPADIIQWQNALLRQEYSATYLRMLQNQVTAIFNHAERLYGLHDNPCKKVCKIGKANADELSFWTVDEYKQFRETLQDDIFYKPLFELLFWTGCRVGEALALTARDIDFDKMQVSITKTYYRHNGGDIITKPKTESSVRNVSIPEDLGKALQEYIQRFYGGLEQEDRLFPITDRAVQKKIVKSAEKAGVKRIRVHDLRHSHVALLIEKGVSPLAIAERVGHDSINTTMNVYGHLYPNRQKEIAIMLNTLM